MAISLQADSTLPQGYILVDGQRVASVSTTGGLSATLADNTVTTSSLVSGSVTTEKIAPGAVVTADLADGAVTAAKMAGGQTGSAPVYGCRAWVNFNGTRNATDTAPSANGQPVFIRASGNVSSVVKNSPGVYTVNLAVPLSDANGCVNVTASFGTPGSDIVDFYEGYLATTSTVQIGLFNASVFQDASNIYVTAFR